MVEAYAPLAPLTRAAAWPAPALGAALSALSAQPRGLAPAAALLRWPLLAAAPPPAAEAAAPPAPPRAVVTTGRSAGRAAEALAAWADPGGLTAGEAGELAVAGRADGPRRAFWVKEFGSDL